MRYFLISLGCAKNTVDAESMGQLLDAACHRPVDAPEKADVLIVNTCGFIEAARAESIGVLRELAGRKRPGQKLIAAGCLSQRYGEALIQQAPAVDGILGTRRWMDIVALVEQLRQGRRPAYDLPVEGVAAPDPAGVQRVAIQGSSAYLKIADGCRRPCAFCAIPLIKGTARSRRPEAIVAEARQLADRGVQEIVLIAQDTTDYGHDLGLRDGLAALVDGILAAAPDLHWLRLMYAYPGAVTPRLIETMARWPQVCHYLDLPLQHSHPDVLKRMRRPADVERVQRQIEALRQAMPDLALRTTFIVGFPGETEAEFADVELFVREMGFDKVGVFTYSHEQGTAAADRADDVPPPVKQERYERLMALQQGISLARNQEQVGRRLEVLLEGAGDGLSLGRSYRDAPEIDGLVLIQEELPVGEMVRVRIVGAMAYDLVGVLER
ncbi:MAG: 30S ribosomal protein S12 methylthiotransferase RimO [Chloroflexota bacterium]